MAGEPTALGDEFAAILDRVEDLARASDEDVQRWHVGQARRERQERLEKSGAADRLDERGMRAIVDDKAESTRALELVRTWMLAPRPVLVLLSEEPGLGKTTAAAWALARLAGRYMRAQELCELRLNYRERQRYYAWCRAELLVIDELGMERDPIEARDTLQDVVDVRQRLPRRTIIMGNLSGKAFNGRYDKRTLDRLGVQHDTAGIAIVRGLKGSSMRASGKENR